MNSKIEIAQSSVDKGKLSIKVTGFLVNDKAGKIRITVVFRNGRQNRRIPLEGDYFYSEEEKGAFFVGKGTLSLQEIFVLKAGEPLEWQDTKVEIEAFNGKENLILEETGILIPREQFMKPSKKNSWYFMAYRIIAAVVCVLLLPLFIIDGCFALKGYKTLDTGENKALGLRGVLLHANVITKRICGFSYSLREVKTKYLKRCYDRYAKNPVKKNTILFLSERLLEENSNMALVKAEIEKDSRIQVTEFINTTTINKLKFGEIRESAKKMAEAGCIVLEDFYPQIHGLSIRKETKVIQLWHACGSFKTFGFSRLGKPGGPKENSGNQRNYDCACVSGSKMVPIYSEAFGIPEQNVKALGVPRTDIFFEEGYKEAVREKLYCKYPQLTNKKVILFAPTFRGAGNKTAYYPTDKINWNDFFENVPEDYFVILKNHPFVKNVFSYDTKWKDRVLDLTGKDNINDLLFITDVLVTDYSSSVFEAALLQIPMVFYVFDKEEYLENRDIYYDFDSFVPGAQAKTEEEFIVAVKAAIEGSHEYTDKYQWFREEFLDALHGNSTQNVTEYIRSLVI